MVNVCMLELSGVVPLNSWSVLFELLVHSSSHVDLSRGNIVFNFFIRKRKITSSGVGRKPNNVFEQLSQ